MIRIAPAKIRKTVRLDILRPVRLNGTLCAVRESGPFRAGRARALDNPKTTIEVNGD